MLTFCPDQERSSIAASLQVGHETVDDMRLRRQKVQRVQVRIGRATMLDLLDVYALSVHGARFCQRRGRVLVTLWLMTSSSFTELTKILRLVSSTTRTFHCNTTGQSPCAFCVEIKRRTSFPAACLIASRMTVKGLMVSCMKRAGVKVRLRSR